MDVNDSFAEQFNGLIQTYNDQESISNETKTKPLKNEVKKLPNKPPRQLEVVAPMPVIKKVNQQMKEEIKLDQGKCGVSEAKSASLQVASVTSKAEQRTKISSNMKAFELAYEKYEKKLKMIEDELLDYNTKCREIDSSPIQPKYKQKQAKVDSPSANSNTFVRSPQMKQRS